MPDDLASQWKQKYLASLDSLERTQQQYQGQVELLRKGLVRVSLAADGLDPALDQQLELLRELLRKDQGKEQLAPLIQQLEVSIVGLDDRRKSEQADLHQQLTKQLERYAQLELPRDTLKAVQSFRNQLAKANHSDSPGNEFWQTLLGLHEKISANLVELSQGSEDNRDGLFSRLFKAKEELSTTINQIEPNAEDSPPQEAAEDTSELSSKVQNQLKHLIEQLDVSVEQKPKKEGLAEQINNEFELVVLPPILEDITHLLSSIRASSQKEYAEFLVALRKRLEEVQDFLVTTRAEEAQAKLNQQKLDQDVRAELKEMRASVEKRDDLAQLKVDIETMVDRIATSVDRFQEEEKNRRSKVYDRIESLASRMASMESEASELKDSLESQRLQALKDALTELPNRASYDEYMNNEYSRWQRHQRPLSMAIVDIDHFKSINDTLGHLRGDKVLKLVAREVSRHVRKEDFVARYGGEEFVVIMPETTLEDGLKAMEKVRQVIASCPFNFNQKPIPVTASIGIAQFAANDTIDSCFERADAALYRAKGSGRNRTEVADLDSPLASASQ